MARQAVVAATSLCSVRPPAPQLPPTACVSERLRPGDTATAVAEPWIRAATSTLSAFAVVASGGLVVTWGSAPSGGDGSAVREQLQGGVQQVYSTDGAAAAVKGDGCVVTWGAAYFGGESARARARRPPVDHPSTTRRPLFVVDGWSTSGRRVVDGAGVLQPPGPVPVDHPSTTRRPPVDHCLWRTGGRRVVDE